MAKRGSEIPKKILDEIDEFELTSAERAYLLTKLAQDSFTFYTPNHENLRMQLWTEPDRTLSSGRSFPGESQAARFTGKYYTTEEKRKALHIYCSKMFKQGQIRDNVEYVKETRDREYNEFVEKIRNDADRLGQLKQDIEAGKLDPVQVAEAMVEA